MTSITFIRLAVFFAYLLLAKSTPCKHPNSDLSPDAILDLPTEPSSKYTRTEEERPSNNQEPDTVSNSDSVSHRYGHGGPYGAVGEASLKFHVEADHAPPKAILTYLENVDLPNHPKLKIIVARRQDLQKRRATHLTHAFSQLQLNPITITNVNQIEGAMGALSLPYHIHHHFSSTGRFKLEESLREASAENMMQKINEIDRMLEKHLDNGIKNGYFENPRNFLKTENGVEVYDYQKLLHQNFEMMLRTAHKLFNSVDSKPNDNIKPPSVDKVKYMKELHNIHNKMFVLSALHHLKMPEAGFSQLMSLFIDEYQLYLGNDFNFYKEGIRQQLEANKDFGWIDENELRMLEDKHHLNEVDEITKAKKTNEWHDMKEKVLLQKVRTRNPIILNSRQREPEITSLTSGTTCTNSARKKRSVVLQDCIFEIEDPNYIKDKQNESSEKLNQLDGLSKIILPSDAGTLSINSKLANLYLQQLDNLVGASRLKSSLIEYISRNIHLLKGTLKDVAMTKAIISIENLYKHHDQNTLAKNALSNLGGGISLKALSLFPKIKLSPSIITSIVSKVTSSTYAGSDYGKIISAKGAITAIQHKDFEHLSLMGGRVGLDIALEGVAKLGTTLAKNATTKLVSEFGAELLGKLAGPVGGLGDIGTSIYNVAKSVKVLTNPDASAHDQNQAVVNILADYIDIALTAVSPVLALTFPLSVPLFIEDERQVAYQYIRNFSFVNERNGSNLLFDVVKMTKGKDWNTCGGSMDNVFIRSNTSLFVGNGILGHETLVFPTKLPNIVSNKNKVEIEGKNLYVSFTDISDIYGIHGSPQKITVGCAIQHLQLGGGNSMDYDYVNFPKLNCKNRITVVADGFTQLSSTTEQTNFDILLRLDANNNLKFKSDLVITNSTVMNFLIQLPAHKLHSSELYTEKGKDIGYLGLRLDMTDNKNFVDIIWRIFLSDYNKHNQNINIWFVDDNFTLNANLLINNLTNESIIWHNIDQGDYQTMEERDFTRRGALSLKNIFSIQGGHWDLFGGKLDDSFIIKNDNFTGHLHGVSGVNSLILDNSLISKLVVVNLVDHSVQINPTLNSSIGIDHIQIVGGRQNKQDKVICGCDTKLVTLEGGASSQQPDEIQIPESSCYPQTSFVLNEFTQIKNFATRGSFTYNIKTHKNFDVKYNPKTTTNHAFILEIKLELLTSVSLDHSLLKLNFTDSIEKIFPLNFKNLPTFQIAQGQDLVSELYLEFNKTVECTTVATSSFRGNITALNGANNKIIVNTSFPIDTIMGGDKDDTIFLKQAQSILKLIGGGGTNRLQLTDEFSQNTSLEVNFVQGNITSLENSNVSMVENVKGIQIFTGRETGFERVIVGCDTKHIKFAEEIVFKTNCHYSVKMEIGLQTRVFFQVRTEPQLENVTIKNQSELRTTEPTALETSTPKLEDVDNYDDEIENHTDNISFELLYPSKFYYYFTSIRSFDIEVETFASLKHTSHIFYLNFTLSQLSSLRFSLNFSRLIYTLFKTKDLETSHLVGEIDEFDMYFKQPEFMTGEGFLLRVTRYGQILASMANPEELLELEKIQQDIIPRLTTYATKLNISLILETGSDFIYCGNPSEINWLTNREIVTSHLVGFNQTTYEILDLNHNVFIYLESARNDSLHIIDLTSIVSQIRIMTGLKYIPHVTQNNNNLEIRMTNFTDKFEGKVILVNGTMHRNSITIMLNSIAMEIIPQQPTRKVHQTSSLDPMWVISPKRIVIPEGHFYALAAEDLENGVEIILGNRSTNSTNEYLMGGNDLIITSISNENTWSGAVSTFAIFDYFVQSEFDDTNNATLLLERNITDCGFGKMGSVRNIRVNLGNDAVVISSSHEITSLKTNKPILIKSYKSMLEHQEFKILSDFPELPRRFRISLPTQQNITKDFMTE